MACRWGRGLRGRAAGICLMVILPAVISSCNWSAKAPQTPREAEQPAGSLAVKVAPEAPTSADALCVTVSGPGPFNYSWQKNGSAIEGETSPRLAPSRFSRLDRVTAFVRSRGLEGSATVIIGNPAPRVASVSFSPAEIQRGVDITAAATAAGPEGGEVNFSYRWSVNGETLSDSTAVLKGDRFQAGDKISLVVVPSDGAKVGPPYQTAPVTVTRRSPWFVSTPSPEFSGSRYTYQALACNPDGTPLSYALASAPRGMSVDAGSGMITWPVTSGDSGNHLVEVIAHNQDGDHVTQRYSVTIRLNGGAVQ